MLVAGVLSRILKRFRFPGAEYMLGVFLLLVGFSIAQFTGEATWFNRLGGLVVVLALVMAAATFRFDQEYQRLRESLTKFKHQTQNETHDLAIITRDGDGARCFQITVPNSILFFLVRNSEFGLEADLGEGVSIRVDKDDVSSWIQIPINKLDNLEQLVIDVKNKDLSDMYHGELIHAAVGTLVWSFGDLFLFWL